jgi:uncharacterized protein (DUF1697 family)
MGSIVAHSSPLTQNRLAAGINWYHRDYTHNPAGNRFGPRLGAVVDANICYRQVRLLGTKICRMPALLVENKGVMALVVFLRGVNVGGHRTFRPSLLANELSDFDLVNVGAAGTFVVRKRTSEARLRAELAKRLPFETEVVICKGDEILELKSANPFAGQLAGPKITWFVSILAKPGRPLPSTPLSLPSEGEWLLKILEIKDRFVLGLYRREMKAIRYLGQLDKLLGVPVTTRNWNTITAIAKILQKAEP